MKALGLFGIVKGIFMMKYYRFAEDILPGRRVGNVFKKLSLDCGCISWFVNGVFLAYAEFTLQGRTFGEAFKRSCD